MSYKRATEERTKMNILLVCTGNTCRSIMAQELLEDAIDKSPLRSKIDVDSAGTFACEGQLPTETAEEAMEELGLEIGRHRAKQVNDELMDWADIVLTMESGHIEELEAMFPRHEEKVHTLIGYANGISGFPGSEGFDVADPYGEPLEEYVECALQLKGLIDKLVKRFVKNLD